MEQLHVIGFSAPLYVVSFVCVDAIDYLCMLKCRMNSQLRSIYQYNALSDCFTKDWEVMVTAIMKTRNDITQMLCAAFTLASIQFAVGVSITQNC